MLVIAPRPFPSLPPYLHVEDDLLSCSNRRLQHQETTAALHGHRHRRTPPQHRGVWRSASVGTVLMDHCSPPHPAGCLRGLALRCLRICWLPPRPPDAWDLHVLYIFIAFRSYHSHVGNFIVIFCNAHFYFPSLLKFSLPCNTLIFQHIFSPFILIVISSTKFFRTYT